MGRQRGVEAGHAEHAEAGHSVLLVPVGELEPFVRERWEHYDAALVSTDPGFTHAHITVLAPFVPRPTGEGLARVGEVVAAVGAFDFRLAEVAAFPDGVIHLRPDPLEPFAELTARLWEAFPGCPPYGGRYADLVPHLTLDLTAPGVSIASTRERLGGLVPVTCRADRVELHWYETGNCHVVHRWALGSGCELELDGERNDVPLAVEMAARVGAGVVDASA